MNDGAAPDATERRKPDRAKTWTVFFDTTDGMCHSIRVSAPNSVLTKQEARAEGEKYLARNRNWLKKISHLYPQPDPAA